jgi:outer membrane protein assembly factor BamB
MWCGNPQRNMVSPEKGMPVPAAAPAPAPETPTKDAKGKRNKVAEPAANTEVRGIKWQVKLGGNTVSTPVIAGGRIFLGTNDWSMPGDGRNLRGGGTVLCLDEATGKVLWALPVPRMRTQAKGFNFDHLGFGVCASGYVEGKRLYIVSGRDDILCLDVSGQADGNDGPYVDEGRYMVGWGEMPNKPGRFDPKTLTKLPPEVKIASYDGDIVWLFDMLAEVDSWPQDAASSSPLVVGDSVFAGTANGVDSSHKNHPSPKAPDLVCVDKKTGRLLGVNENPIGERVFHGQWSSPTLATVGGKDLIIFGGGDGICYAYDPKPVAGEAGKPGLLKKVWSFDVNPAAYRAKGYSSREGCSEIDATPVFYKNRVYVTIGQDTEHGTGRGCLSCIDATKTGDITATGKVWQYEKLDRSMSSPTIYNDLVFVADFTGIMHCVNANTGQAYWTHDLHAHTISSALVADGKVYQCDEEGKMTVFAATAEKKVLGEMRFGASIWASPVAANGTLYVTTKSTLYALKGTAPAAPTATTPAAPITTTPATPSPAPAAPTPAAPVPTTPAAPTSAPASPAPAPAPATK